MGGMDLALLIARLVLAGVLAVAAVAKIRDAGATRRAITDFGGPSALAPALSVLVPLLELSIAVLLLPVATAAWAAVAALVLLALFTAAIAVNLSRGRAPSCNCFGAFSRRPVGPQTLVRNGVLMALAAFVAVAGWDDAGDSLGHRLRTLPEAGWVGLLFAAAFVVSIVSMAWLGRPARRAGADDDDGPTGLVPGTPAPGFRAEAVDGGARSLDELRRPGLPTLLVFADPHCRSCAALLPEVARWQRELAGELTVAVVAAGERGDVRAEAGRHGLHTVLLQPERNVSDAYRILGTPAAVVVGADGRIALDAAEGAEEIRQLMDRERWRVRLDHR
jgi:uncharacterized membrane protein YphA (DoxX/SURF4 family)